MVRSCERKSVEEDVAIPIAGPTTASCPKTQTNSRLARRAVSIVVAPWRGSCLASLPQIWGVSEAMSAIRLLRTRRENTVQQRDATLPGGDLDPGPGRTWTRTC